MADFYTTGTVSVSNGGTTVTGSGVLWSDVRAGDTLVLVGLQAIIASAPVSPYTSLTLTATWAGTTLSGSDYTIVYNAPSRFTSAYLATQVRALIERTSIIEAGAPVYSVIAKTNTPPSSPVANDAYALGSSPTGPWSGNAGKLAQWTGSAWAYTTPEAGWQAYAVGDRLYVYDSGWQPQADMTQAEYDPTGVGADAFDSANHAFDPTGTGLSSTNVQDAVAELDTDLGTANTAIAGKMATAIYDPSNIAADAFLASNHWYTPATGMTATNVDAAIDELAGKVIPVVSTSTPTPTSTTGTITTASSSLKAEKIGTRVRLSGTVTVTTAGTGANGLQVALPYQCGSTSSISGDARETLVTGNLCSVTISASGTVLTIFKYDNTTIIGDGRAVTFSITYDAAS
ncbi:DUF2793 domain-containing protein [Ancylobacter sp. IITR112]|uniref:DUF2793 domain-containing protein n=1 Tax=Ancylobacter sp. IITR112 TaxID=3138073 RepID=UPI00352BACBA